MRACSECAIMNSSSISSSSSESISAASKNMPERPDPIPERPTVSQMVIDFKKNIQQLNSKLTHEKLVHIILVSVSEHGSSKHGAEHLKSGSDATRHLFTNF
jgi:hypothetical protein